MGRVIRYARGLLYILAFDMKKMLDNNKNSLEVKEYTEAYLKKNFPDSDYVQTIYN